MRQLANIKDTSLSLPKDDTLTAVNYAGGFGAVLAQYCFLLSFKLRKIHLTIRPIFPTYL